jgi:glutamate/tyrosine decarboxylase-like PLP-dependent enzyme
MGTDAIRWIAANERMQIDVSALRQQIEADRGAGERPILVVGNAGTVSTGAVDPLSELAAICREFDLWFHVDGAYGAMAAILPEASQEFAGLSEADSIAVDPHKWLYAPLEAGCALVRDREKLRDAFSYHPPYYHFETEAINYYDLGPQNSRDFRALKVWLALQQAGRDGYVQTISEDIRLAGELFRRIAQTPELEALTQNLSITTFRFIPRGLEIGGEEIENYLDQLNNELLTRVQNSGEAYLSNAIVRGRFALRVCIVNFRTTQADIEALPPLIVRIGEKTDAELRPAGLRRQGQLS